MGRCKAAKGEDDGSVLLYVTEAETRRQRRRCLFGRDWFKVKINGQMQGRQGRGRRERTFVRDLVREPMATPQMPVYFNFKRMTWAVAA